MTGIDQSAIALRSVRRGDPSVMLICSASTAVLSRCSREFVRTLRSEGARVEFHTPGQADGVLQSTNRLLEGIALEAILSSAESLPPHLLIVDDAELLSAVETAALRRLIQGLRGSAFRVLLLVSKSRSEAERLPLADLNDLMVIWDADRVEGAPPIIEQRVVEPPKVTPTPTTPPSIVSEDAAPIPDVLADLARERAETRGFDATFSRRWMMTPLKVTALVIGVLLLGYGITSAVRVTGDSETLIYDCGSHPDRESVDVLLVRVGRSTPTQVTKESGRLRLHLGPFSSQTAAKAAREQAWLLGSCRVNPTVVRAIDPLTRKAGG
ncbi:MAG: hypothetical protein FJ196_05590 [Gammaproteobacteria bacterium]|nr:hypothetical protein [Gammaproteobacteria bacterium]